MHREKGPERPGTEEGKREMKTRARQKRELVGKRECWLKWR